MEKSGIANESVRIEKLLTIEVEEEEKYHQTIFDICRYGDVRTLEQLKIQHTKLNLNKQIQRNGIQLTPLMIAVIYGRIKLVENLLIENKVDVNKVNDLGYSALHYAAREGRLSIMNKLINHGANIELKSKHVDIALAIAIQHNHLKIVDRLLELSQHFQRQMFTIALKLGNRQIVNRFIDEIEKYKIDKEKYKVVLHDMLLANRNASVINLMYERQIISLAYTDEKNGRNILHRIVSIEKNKNSMPHNQRVIIENLIQQGNLIQLQAYEHSTHVIKRNDRFKNEMTALHLAVYYNHIQLYYYFYDKGFDINATDGHNGTPLHSAAYHSNYELLTHLIKHGAVTDMKYDGNLALHIAARQGNIRIFKWLLQLDHTRINERGFSNYTPLHYAVEHQNEDLVQYLLKKEAQMDVNNNAEESPCDLAILINNLTILKYFLFYSVCRNHYQYVDLILSIPALQTSIALMMNKYYLIHAIIIQPKMDEQIFYRIVSVLMEIKDPEFTKEVVNSRDSFGYSPLHYTCMNGYEKLTESLIGLGAKINVKTPIFQYTPLMLAKANGHDGVVKVLLKHNADKDD
mmetsp:Transcript_11638/g.17231  ORF Transcript_11638/g.17231 Transcript_11638/m.17231 type:complete len:575 (+) Transcript_11638:34-1758(+)